MKPFKSKIRLAVSASILILTVIVLAICLPGCSDDSSELTNQIKVKEQEILKLQQEQNQLINMYNQLESSQVSSQSTNQVSDAPNYPQEGVYQPAPAQPSTIVVQPSESHSDSALTGGMAGFMLGHALGNLGNNGANNNGGGGYNGGSRTVINKTIINHTPNTFNTTSTKAPSAVRLPPRPTAPISKPSTPISKPVSKPSTFTKSYSQPYSSPSRSYSFTRRR